MVGVFLTSLPIFPPKKSVTLKRFFWSQVAGLLMIGLMVLIAMPSFALTPFFLLLAVLCGILYAFGYLLFYKGFEIGNVSVVSAVINLQVIFVMGISYFLRGQTLTPIQIPAMIMLLLGILLVSVNFANLKKGTISLLAGVKETLISAVIFGVFYWPVNELIVEKFNWLSVAFVTKFVAIITVFLLMRIKRQEIGLQKIPKKMFHMIVTVGVLEAVGVLSSNYGQAYGDGIIVAPISSALTLVTVTLAVIFLKEKISKPQLLGIILAISGIILSAF